MSGQVGVIKETVLHRYKPYAKRRPRSPHSSFPALEKLSREILETVKDVRDPVLRDAINHAVEEEIPGLLERITRIKRSYANLPLRDRAEEEIRSVKWRRNEDGSLWGRKEWAPNLTMYVWKHGGKAPLGGYAIYLTRGGYLKLYPRGGGDAGG